VRWKLKILGLTLPIVIAIDIATKRWALDALAARRDELFGGLVPLTLAFNKGAAFGLRVGDDSRWLFVPITVFALGLLGVLLKQAVERDYLRVFSIALVVSGALGNLYDRLRWGRGVVDFIGPIDLGFWDFPIFNAADIAITCGAVLLAISFWFEEQAERRADALASTATPAPDATDDLPGEASST
jgi:signal peptidase II